MHRAARFFALLLLLVAGAQAHPILQNPVWIESSPDRITVNLHVSVRELIVVQGLPVTTEGHVDQFQAEEMAPKHSAYLLDHWQVKADGILLQGTVQSIKPPKVIGEGLEGPDRSHFSYTIEYPLARPPQVLTFSQNMCVEFPSAPGVPWDLSYAYRYGPHGETPRKFGALARDQTLSFKTGWIIVREPMAGTLLGLWIVFLFATVLGRTFSLPSPFPYTGPVAAWATGFCAVSVLPSGIPAWPLYLAAAATAILTATDNIHGAAAAPRRYRLILLYAGTTCFGALFAGQQREFPELGSLWQIAPLPAAILTILTAAGISVLMRRRPSRIAVLLVQLASLICCLNAAWFMLRLLEVPR